MPRALAGLAVSLALATFATTALAEPNEPKNDAFTAFPVVEPHDKHYVRAAVEVGGVLFVGYVDYLLNTTARGGITRAGDQRWDLRYDWPDLRAKFIGTSYQLDSNKFNTNYISHPFAGTMYFQAARSSHLSFAESWLYSALGSLFWETFGEVRENSSVNDLVTTPVAGAALGETTMQLSGFFDRGSDNASNRILSAIFAPVKAINRIFDPAEPVRTRRPDALGFATEPWHRFEIYGGGGATMQSWTTKNQPVVGQKTLPSATYPDTRFGFDLQVKNLPGYAGAGHWARSFDDGNVSGMSFDATVSRGSLVNGAFAARVVPIGFYWRDARVDRHGDIEGQGALLGLRIGYEYVVHAYDRDRARPIDLICNGSPIGIAAEHVFEHGGFRVRTGLDIAGSFSGVKAYALSDYLAQHSLDGLPQAIKSDGYYHAYGVSAMPSLDIRYGVVEWRSSLRLDTFHAIEGIDEAAVDPTLAAITDRRSIMRTAFAIHPPSAPWELTVGAMRNTRAGQLGPVRASRSESSFFGTLGLVF